MREYRKIQNLFKFDPEFKNIVGYNEPYDTLKNIEWYGTEKVDGTNVRVHWDGHEIVVAGRTDRAVFPNDLDEYLQSVFKTQEMEYLFEQVFGEKEAFVFGEGYGPKIQAGGGNYSDRPQFIVFDVSIESYELSRKNVEDVANKLGLQVVPIVFQGTLTDAKEYVVNHPVSTINNRHEMEGIVLSPSCELLFNQNGGRLKCKCKYMDMLKAGLIDNK